MKKTFQKALCLYVVVCFVALVGQMELYAAAPTVKIVVSPNQTDIEAGSDAVALTAQTTGTNLTYKWVLSGPGELSGIDLPGVFYTPPKTLSKKSTALVTVIVTDRSGREVTESMTFNISPADDTGGGDRKKGMSTTTKVALGVGAAALAIGGIALLADGDDDNNAPPFSGKFQRNVSGTSNQGNPYTEIHLLKLTQNDSLLSGTLTYVSTLTNCCTATFATGVSGNATGNSGSLSWGAAVGRCDCSWATWLPEVPAINNAAITLTGDVLTFEGGAELSRISKASSSAEVGIEGYESYRFEGDFIRE